MLPNPRLHTCRSAALRGAGDAQAVSRHQNIPSCANKPSSPQISSVSQRAFDFCKFSREQRLELIGELWDNLEANLSPLEPALIAELDRHLAEFRADPTEGRPAAEVIARIRATLR